MNPERRENRRLQLDRDGARVRVTARIGGAEHDGHAVDLSECGVRIVLPPDAAGAPRVDAQVGPCTLIVADRQTFELESLSLACVRRDEDRVVVTLTTDDSATRATLWQAMNALAFGAGTARSGNAEIEKVPARGQYSEAARQERLQFIRRKSGRPLEAYDHTRVAPDRLTSNIENMIGTVEVPVGLAGPLMFRGSNVKGAIYAPLATTEGALVASCTRGATAISRSGGVRTRVVGQRMMRVPMFVLSTFDGAWLFASWVRDHLDALREQVALVSRHARLVSVEPAIIGKMVHVYFTYETGDAAGQNMTTAATWQCCQWIREQLQFLSSVELEDFLIDANMSSDKKVTFQSFLSGRGIRVVAECLLDGDVMRKVLKVTPEQLTKANAAFVAASVQIGMIGHNINVANVVAAMFTATGQDIACVHESSVAQLHLEPAEGGMRASVSLPSLIIGTVGGGTHLPAQKAALDLLGCAGPGQVYRLAEIIAGFCLSLDLSTLSAIVSGEFASAHERLGRSRPVEWFQRRDLDEGFFQGLLQESMSDPELKVRAVDPLEVDVGSSIITELTQRKVDKLVGLIPLRVAYDAGSEPAHVDVVAKVKPRDEEVILMVNSLAAMSGPDVAEAHAKFKHKTGMAGCDDRELGVYEQTDPRFTHHAPRVYGTFRDKKREACVVVLEKLEGLALMDTADDVSEWRPSDIETVLRGIAQVHSIWYGREKQLRAQPWLGDIPTSGTMTEMTALWSALARHASDEFPELITDERKGQLDDFVRTIGQWWPRIEVMPRTLIHNDFNPRNLALRDDGGERRLCAYDWELATMHLPQHDLAELLAFVLPPDVDADEVDEHIETHRAALELAVGTAIDPEQWHHGYVLSLRDLAVNRFGLYLMAHTFRHYGFMERTVNSLWRLIDIETARAGTGRRAPLRRARSVAGVTARSLRKR